MASSEPSRALVGAALAGLFGLALTSVAGCGSDSTANIDSSGASGGSHSHEPDEETGGSGGTSSDGTGGTSSGGSADLYNNVLREDVADMTQEEFRSLCEERGGYTYLNAACATSSMCRGLSLHDGTLWEHSCRGQNSSCAGIGCVDMPEDKGATGQEIFETTACGDCHADWSQVVEDDDVPDYSRFAVFYDPSQFTGAASTKRFVDSTDVRLESIVVWGVSGFHEDHTPFSNMPTYYQKYSLAEIRRVVAYIRTLSPLEHPYDIYGKTNVSKDPGPTGGN